MQSKIIQGLILCAVAFTAFLAFYLRQPPPVAVPEPEKVSIPELEKVSEPPKFLPTFTIAADPDRPVKVGILGESRGDAMREQAINTAILVPLLEALKIQQVQAIFFTGNLVSGIEKNGTEKPITAQALEQQLQEFLRLYHSMFNSTVPFFPALGEREVAIPDASEIFISQFQLSGVLKHGTEISYTVSIGQAFFAIMATNEISILHRFERPFTASTLDWLRQVLSEAAKTHRYLFVLGYEPAFPSASTFLSIDAAQRDKFWRILVDNNVLAYFSSREHIFDRSNRHGVWQIISGGGGASLSKTGAGRPFFHSLLLTIPANNKKNPTIKILDVSGKSVDEFELKPTQEPLFQMRISQS